MLSSLSEETAWTRYFWVLGLGTTGSGVIMSWQRSAVKGRISSYRYHCRLASSPFGRVVCGISPTFGTFCFSSSCTRKTVSENSWTRRVVDPSLKWKWWNFLMLIILWKNLARNIVHPKDGTITSPFSVPHNYDKFTSDDCSTTANISWRQSTFVLRYSLFTSPKHQSQK